VVGFVGLVEDQEEATPPAALDRAGERVAARLGDGDEQRLVAGPVYLARLPLRLLRGACRLEVTVEGTSRVRGATACFRWCSRLGRGSPQVRSRRPASAAVLPGQAANVISWQILESASQCGTIRSDILRFTFQSSLIIGILVRMPCVSASSAKLLRRQWLGLVLLRYVS
jgi:hypothetical protein